MKKILLIDDEAPARQLLREYLADYPALVIVGEANNGVDALRLIDEFRPDLIFLDVQMPGMSGLELIQELEELPQIIFSTAYDQYALKAFELNAVDYLLKPFTRKRFAKAIERVMTEGSDNLHKVQALTENLMVQHNTSIYPEKVILSKGTRLVAIPTRDIIRIQADKDYSEVVTARDTYLSSHGIGQLEERLDPAFLVRVHRSTIVNMDEVEEIFRYGNGYDLRMSNQDVVRVSRSYAEVIKKWII